MYHEVTAPKAYRAGRAARSYPSQHEYYVEAYEQGWWACVEECARDIDFVASESDMQTVGRDVRIEGALYGYMAAYKRIQENIKKYGKEATQRHLLDILNEA